MGFELNAYYVQEKTATLYELLKVDTKAGRVVLQNVATLTITPHNMSWAKDNLEHLRSPVADDVSDPTVPREWVVAA